MSFPSGQNPNPQTFLLCVYLTVHPSIHPSSSLLAVFSLNTAGPSNLLCFWLWVFAGSLSPMLDELEALGLIVGQTSLKQYRVHTELCVEQWHVTIHLDEEVDALVALVEMRVIM